MNTGQNLVVSLLFASGFVFNVLADAPAKGYVEGSHYHRIEPPQPVQSADDHIEVVELFFYACPLCNTLEPKIREWLKRKPDDVEFRRIPAIIGPTWAEQAKAFYVAEALGTLEKTHQALFSAIHNDGEQYYSEFALMQFFVDQGVEADRFLELYRSPEIVEKASQARVMTVRYGLQGVPAMIVNGKYKTASYYTRNLDEMLEVVDWLIEKERADYAANASSERH